MWHLLDVLNIIWNPPLRNLAIQERLKLVWRDITLTVLHHNQEWALAPLGMDAANNRGLTDAEPTVDVGKMAGDQALSDIKAN